MGEKSVWVIHAGQAGEANTLFLERGQLALGWVDAGDLTDLPPDRTAFKQRVEVRFPQYSSAQIPNAAGQLFRFIHEMKAGDLVVYRSKQDRRFHIGEVTGPYVYLPELEAGYPHTRAVRWIGDFSKNAFTPSALAEFGGMLTFFRVKSHADQVMQVIGTPKQAVPKEVEDDAGPSIEGLEDYTGGFILRRLSENLKGLGFETFVQHLLECMGYRARLSRTNEPSVDIVAHKDSLGLEPPVIKVQVKSQDGKVGDRDVSALYGKIGDGESGLFVALGEFSATAWSYAASKPNLRLVDGDELVELIYEHYERFNARYRALLPLKRIYVPFTDEP